MAVYMTESILIIEKVEIKDSLDGFENVFWKSSNLIK